MNTLDYGDNLDIFRRYIKDESVDFVYLDPPFKSNQNYNVLFQELDGTRCDANLSGANLSRANLSRAGLSVADLSGSILSDANLRETILSHANLRETILSHADLRGANLRDANLSGAILIEADLSGAYVSGTVFVNVDLRTVKNLKTLRHQGPSSIAIDTIYKSNGEIPETFLYGAGVPEPFIANMRSLVAAMSPIQFYSCFISYSTLAARGGNPFIGERLPNPV